MSDPARIAIDLPRLVSSDELARAMGYEGPHNAFRDWLVKMKITPVPGRKGYYDPRLVRLRLDQAQGIGGEADDGQKEASPIEKRRGRRGA